MTRKTSAKLLFIVVVIIVFGLFIFLRSKNGISNQPYIESVFPPQVPAGSVIVISGHDFSPNKTENSVSIGNINLPIAEAGQYHLVVMIPDKAKTGMIVVNTKGVASNPIPLEIFGSDTNDTDKTKTEKQISPKEHAMGNGAMPHMFFDGKDSKDAPNFKLPDSQGNLHTLSELKGNFVVLNFWASWCEPCVAEVPSLMNMAKHYANSNLKVVAISIDKTWKDAQRIISPNTSNILVLLDTKDKIAPKYGTEKIPETYIINPQGKIIAKFIGSRQWDSQLFIRYFKQIMGNQNQMLDNRQEQTTPKQK